MDVFRVLAKRWSCSTIFLWTSSVLIYVKLKNFSVNSTVLYTSNSTVLYTSNSNCSSTSNSNCSCVRQTQCFLAAPNSKYSTQLHQWVLLLRERSHQRLFYQCILREEFRYFVLCILFKNITVSCIKDTTSIKEEVVYTTLSTLDSALIYNSEIPLRILILWLCLPNILKRVVRISWYVVVLYKFVHYVRNCKFSLKKLGWKNFLRLLWTTSKSCNLSWKNFLCLLWMTSKSCKLSRIDQYIYIYIPSASLSTVNQQSIVVFIIKIAWLSQLANSTLFFVPSNCIL